jgi:hypothetical protein
MKTGIKVVKNFVFGTFLLTSLVILPIKSVKADIVHHLYEAEFPVEGQSREERTNVIREALKVVLARISGRDSASLLAMDKVLIPNPSSLVQQFRYRHFNPDEVIPAAPVGAKPYTQKLWLRFTEKAISQLLVEQGLPIWGKSRPSTLLWLVVDDQKQRILIGNNTPDLSRTFIEQEAEKRGLPIRLPLLDLADQSKVQITDVWGNFEDTILSASERYQTEAILVGRIYLSFGNTWNTRWTLYMGGQRQDWEFANTTNLQDAVKLGIDKTGEALSLRFAQLKDVGETNTVLVQVKNITNLKTYEQAINYLQGLNIVSDVNPYKVSKDNVIFSVNSHSGRLGLAQAISLGRILVTDVYEPVVQEGENKGADSQQLQAALVYNLVP